MTFAQDPATAKFGSMPQAAIARGGVDFVLSPEAIAEELTKLGHHPYIAEENIRISEGDHLIRQAASKMLRKKDYFVVEASDGTAALDLIRAHNERIDALLLDVTLAGASSREVFEEPRRLKPGMPVIVTSANSKEMAAASLACRVERFIRKPFGLDDLIGLIHLSMSS
jgi:DNA-binding NtrC family response regulator